VAMYDCYIINEDLGHWDNDGNWWSNDGYKASAWSNMFRKSNDYYDLEDIGGSEDNYMCYGCGLPRLSDDNPYYCFDCGTCYDCSMVKDDGCLCWTPEREKSVQHKQTTGGYDGQYDFGF